MNVPTPLRITVATLVVSLCATAAHAQFKQPLGPIDYHHDFQLFAPVELDFGNEPCDRCDGYFFSYDKLYWAADGERNVVGDPNIRREVFPVYFDNAPENLNPQTGGPAVVGLPVQQVDLDLDGDGTIDIRRGAPINPDNDMPIDRPFFQSGIQSTVPTAVFAFGDRYEMGYVENDRGWLLGIVDGPKHQDGDLFGFNGGAHDQRGQLRGPFGDVYVGFDYAPGLLHGFLDIFHGEGGVDGQNGSILIEDSDGDGILDGDGFHDDIDEDGQFGADGFDLEDPAEVPETFIIGMTTPDYDDLVEFPTSWHTLSVRSVVETDGIELMKMHRIDNRHKMRKHQNNYLEIYYGARYMRFDDQFVVTGTGGALGDSFWDTQIVNNLIGPQLMFRWINQHGKWSTNVQGRFMFGYNVTNWRLTGGIGEDILPAQANHPLYLRRHVFQYGNTEDEFSPLGELRAEATYRLSKAMALRLGWTGFFVDNVRRASQHVLYRLPDMGLRDGGTQGVFINGVTMGFEFNH